MSFSFMVFAIASLYHLSRLSISDNVDVRSSPSTYVLCEWYEASLRSSQVLEVSASTLALLVVGRLVVVFCDRGSHDVEVCLFCCLSFSCLR